MTAPTDVVVRAELLDCVQANLALLADRAHGAGRHLALGARLRFAPVPGPDGLPTVERTLDEHLLDARRLLGLAVAGTWRAATSADLLRGHDLVYVVADAFHLPWVPYHGHEHMDHSFLVEAGPTGFVVHDAYHNDTEWGSARPDRRELSAAELSAALPDGARVFRLDPVDPPAGVRPRQDHAGPEVVDAYVRAYREHPDRVAGLRRLTLETWLLARSRRLHAACHEEPAVFEEHVRRWEALAEQTYLAYRRVARGRAEPPGVLPRLADLLAADRVVFDGLRREVAAVVARVLGVDPVEVLRGEPFPGFPSFSSFRVVDIVERLESALGVEFDAEDLVPEHLHRLDDLCRLVSRSSGGPE
ncbi:acyl carrier protein [Saccharothrix lopnurensis]|uniref:Acyl carrier protein n=1 Tax=Saccharothrix lopnurensis TaxID=1670621 RepID=A0ABW1PFS4_9PSEU